jgi:hypothetical protein
MRRRVKDDDAVRFFRKIWVDVDVASEYKRLKRIGSVPANQLRDRDRLLKELNDAQDNAARAETLYLKARELYDRFLVGHNKRLHKLEKRAVARLKEWLTEIKAGSRKQITQDMVVKEICSKRDTREPYEELLEREIEVRRVRDACKSLSKKWDDRRWTLGAQAKLLGGITEPDLESGRKRRRR